MAITVLPAAIPNPKKNGQFDVTFVPSGGIAPYSWAKTAGTNPAWMSFEQVTVNVFTAGVPKAITALHLFGRAPNVLAAAGATLTYTVTDSTPTTPLTATVTTATSGTVIDGPDPTGYHGTEANRTTATDHDQYVRGNDGVTASPLPVADAIARMWPTNPPAQNS